MSDEAVGIPQLSRTRAQLTAFMAMCERDLWVIARRDLAGFLAQSLLQPLFYLFIFGRVLPEIGAARGSYGTQLLPGILGLTLFLTALQNTALPLVIDFSFTKEIEDRLLAPLSAWGLGVQKMVMASLRAIVAALAIIPLARSSCREAWTSRRCTGRGSWSSCSSARWRAPRSGCSWGPRSSRRRST
jgi:ABC-2 type transport system permease protein